jgi:beta-aspartyl-peptidase (threonine type)
LRKGGKAIDAVEAAVRVMEDCPLFNAGKGAVFTLGGKVRVSMIKFIKFGREN